MTTRLLVRDCDVVVTMNDAGTEIGSGSILIEDGVIAWTGAGTPPSAGDLETIDGSGLVAVPGLVNTHHHLYQTLTRVRAQESGLFDWLRELYPAWAELDAEWVHTAAMVGIGELALSGCTTVADHHYVFPPGTGDLLGAEIEAARTLGVRIHACRGSMDLGQSAGGLPPDRIVQDPDAILAETEQALARHHDPAPGAMVRIAVGPCSPFSASRELMQGSAGLARKHGVRLHTHIAETADELAFCQAQFGRRPVELLDDLGFLGSDVWLAHCVHLDHDDIGRIAASSTSVAWCPTSNLRLGSGIAPIRELLEAGASVGLAVDGSSSNDGGDLLAECRMGMLIARSRQGPAAMTARQALRLATRGGAACLGRDDIGSIAPGMRADVALFEVGDLAHVGAGDPVAALVFCSPRSPRHLLVEGRPVVRDHRLVAVDQDEIARLARAVVRGGRA